MRPEGKPSTPARDGGGLGLAVGMICAVVVLLVLAACGGGGKGNSAAPTDEAPRAVESATAAATFAPTRAPERVQVLTRADGTKLTPAAQRQHVDGLIASLGVDFVCSPWLLAPPTGTPEPHQTRADVEALHRIHVEACGAAGRR